MRLDAQRALISLFSRHEQHILTESTRTLSLQDDTDHIARDGLWIGNCTMSYSRSFFNPSRFPLNTTSPLKDQLWVVPDLTQDPNFKDHPDVTSYPNIRFLASSPIISPKGIVIGAYTVLDDKPRTSLDSTTSKFLLDMGTTVMEYLVSARSRSQHLRSERMIVGIGSFLEGKGSLRNSWLEATGKLNYLKGEYGDDIEGGINKTQQDKQVSDSVSKAMKVSGAKNRSLPLRSKVARKNHHLPLKTLPETTTPASLERIASKEDHQVQLEDAFSRAANIIRESIEVEGSIFFDANFGTHGASVAAEKSDHEGSGHESYSSASGDEGPIRGPSNAKTKEDTTAHAADSGKDTSSPCRVLGFSTSNASSVNDESTGDRRIALSEPFLAGLLRRYPQGKIFNFFEDGSISASETSDCNFKNFSQGSEQQRTTSTAQRPGRKYKRTRKAILRQDAETLLQLAPNSRSIIFSPLWDSHKGRWYSANICWTQSPRRVFTSDDELSFLFAFGYSMMAEVHRLNSVFSEKAKSSLLAGLSHELRSPLHGIFGMTDLLNTSVMNTLQRGFIHTISSCAFTLLGSINQLLEFASIKDLRATSVATRYTGGPNKDQLLKTVGDSSPGEDHEDARVELAAVVEDSVETILTGYTFFNVLQYPADTSRGGKFFQLGRFDTPDAVQVVLDIAGLSDLRFITLSGAWHSILTNIVGNALKFTHKGYVHVSLNADPVTLLESGEVVKSNIELTVRDSGCGIETEFLRNELFSAFAQEDSMTIGNGLGLNITQRIVHSLGGSVEIASQKGVGTEVKVSVDLEQTSAPDLPSQHSISTVSSLASAQDLVRAKTVGFIGHWSSESDLAVRSSLQNLCQKDFLMDIHLISSFQPNLHECDFYILSFKSFSKGNLDIKAFGPSLRERASSPVIVLCPSPRIAHSMFAESQKHPTADIVVFISQPFGPRKLAKAFETCLERQEKGIDITASEDDRASETPNAFSAMEDKETDFRKSPNVSAPLSTGQSSVDSIWSDYFGTPLHQQDSYFTPKVHPTPIIESSEESIVSNSSDTNDFSQPQQHDSSRTTVLIVDDNNINIQILVEFMKKLKCNYATASNGLEALEFFEANAPSIALIFMGKYRLSPTPLPMCP